MGIRCPLLAEFFLQEHRVMVIAVPPTRSSLSEMGRILVLIGHLFRRQMIILHNYLEPPHLSSSNNNIHFLLCPTPFCTLISGTPTRSHFTHIISKHQEWKSVQAWLWVLALSNSSCIAQGKPILSFYLPTNPDSLICTKQTIINAWHMYFAF